jgi:hypothetical protein
LTTVATGVLLPPPLVGGGGVVVGGAGVVVGGAGVVVGGAGVVVGGAGVVVGGAGVVVGGAGVVVGGAGVVVVRPGDVVVGGWFGGVVGAPRRVVGGAPVLDKPEPDPPPPVGSPTAEGSAGTIAVAGVGEAERTPPGGALATSATRRRATWMCDRAGALRTTCAGVSLPPALGQPRNPTTALASTNRRAAPTTIEPAVPSPARYARVARTLATKLARLDAPLSSVMIAKSSLPFKGP